MTRMSRAPPPFPQRLVKKTEDGKYWRFLMMLKLLSIIVPLVEALEQMLGYAKFITDLVRNKRSVTFEDDNRMQQYCAIATRSLVQKKKNLGAFTIPCKIGLLHFSKALCYLGEDKSHVFLYLQDVGGDPKPTMMLILMVVKRRIEVYYSW